MALSSLVKWATIVSSFLPLASSLAARDTTTLHTFVRRDLASTLAPQLSPGATIVLPSEPNWQNITERWDQYQAPSFRAAVQAATEDDVVAVVKYANSRNISFFVQGGGHGFAPLDSVQDAIMIQMRNFNSIVVDSKTGVATVGGGIVYSEVINATYAAGREITVGSCPCAGLIGAGLGGGIGRLQGLHGLTLDTFLRYRVVLADGEVIDVTAANRYKDLWWAIRGAGHNFGIVVEADVQTSPQASGGLFYNADLALSDDKLEAGLAIMNEQIVKMPAELAVEVVFQFDPATLAPIFGVNIQYAGNFTEGQTWSAPWKALGTESFTDFMVTWQDIPSKTEGGNKNVDCLNYGYKDIYSLNLKLFDIPTMRKIHDSFNELIAANPDANASTIIFEVYSQEGVRSRPVKDSAFPNRKHMNILALIFGWWTNTKITNTIDGWLSNARTEMNQTSGYDKLYLYQNYAKDEPVESYYGYESWRLERLRRVKRKYDPENRFFGYHPIPL